MSAKREMLAALEGVFIGLDKLWDMARETGLSCSRLRDATYALEDFEFLISVEMEGEDGD